MSLYRYYRPADGILDFKVWYPRTQESMENLSMALTTVSSSLSRSSIAHGRSAERGRGRVRVRAPRRARLHHPGWRGAAYILRSPVPVW